MTEGVQIDLPTSFPLRPWTPLLQLPPFIPIAVPLTFSFLFSITSTPSSCPPFRCLSPPVTGLPSGLSALIMENDPSSTSPTTARPFPCHYCPRRFRRLEHKQRHERTHTKETPFKCYCGRAFARRDLLRRHEKLAHGDSAGSGRMSVKAVGDLGEGRRNSTAKMAVPFQYDDGLSAQHGAAATTLLGMASEQSPRVVASTAGLAMPSAWSPFDIFDGFLDMADPGAFIDPAMIMDPWTTQFDASATTLPMSGGAQNLATSTPVFVSELPMPSHRPSRRIAPDASRWRISGAEYKSIVLSVEEFSDVLPVEFSLLTRHTMSRYLEGCIKGFCEHFPFIHFATFTAAEAAPELLLAMSGMGAEFRFERHRAPMLFHAAKAIIEERMRRRNSAGDSSMRTASTMDSLSSPATNKTPDSQHTTERHTGIDNTHSLRARWQRLQTYQAMIIVLAIGAWSSETLLREALSLQSLAAILARDSNAHIESLGTPLTYHDWAYNESLKRTRFMFYSLLQLMSIAYNIPPLIYTSEISCDLPGSAAEWMATDAESWLTIRRTTAIHEPPFQTIFSQLFQDPTTTTTLQTTPISRFAAYTLLLGLLQTIVLKRQSLNPNTPSLPNHDVTTLTTALKRWQSLFEHSPESSLPGFETQTSNTTALLRLAWIRLHIDLGPSRNLASRDPKLIAAAFSNIRVPPLDHRRNGELLLQPVLQATHALSVPIRMGINYVAKTQTSSWSVQNSLSNLECAILVSKWLETLAEDTAGGGGGGGEGGCRPLEQAERVIVQTVVGLVRESGMFDEDEGFGEEDFGGGGGSGTRGVVRLEEQKRMMRRLAGAVARLWAEIFKGIHVFELVNIIGASLVMYAEGMEGVWEGEEVV